MEQANKPNEASTLDWTPPSSIYPNMKHSAPYPIQALPKIIRDPICSYHQYGQQPLPLIACSALANVSLACQSLANVARDRFLVSPVSLYFLVVAGSGERKSAADNTFNKSIRKWQIEARERLEPAYKASQILHQAWYVEKEGLLSQLRRRTRSGGDIENLRQELVGLVSNEPKRVLLPSLFYEDATQEALASHLAHGWPSASLWSDEAGIVMGGHGMQASTTKFISLLNRLWDGKSFVAHRKTSKSFTIADRRLTVSLMMQPLILEQMISKNGGVSRQSGFLARSLIAYPTTSMGHRQYQEPPESMSTLSEFHDRVFECLQSSLSLTQKGCHDLPLLTFSESAKNLWIDFFNKVESGLAKSTHWSSIKDFASKAGENVARLAALFHLFEGKEGPISADDVDKASQIIYWHLSETKLILGGQPQTPLEEDSKKLLEWFIEKGLTEATPRYLLQYSPLRDKLKRDKALRHLEENNYIRKAKRDGKTMVITNPYLFEQH